MKIIAIISEYNPFHSGHLYQIKKIKEEIKEAKIIAIMSGNYVQRGEPAILDKFIRTKYSILNGVDLVLQLPTIYSLQSAENFASGGINIIKSINCVDYISFGIESNNFNDLLNIAEKQYNNKVKLDFLINKYKELGKSYSVAYKDATNELFDNRIHDNLFLSNNILAIEYIKNIMKLKVNINYLPINRQGNNYLDENISINKFSSATSIRKSILSRTNNIAAFIDENLYSDLLNTEVFPQLNDYFEILKYNLLILKRNMTDITGFENGLDHLFYKNIFNAKNTDDLVKFSISKRYKKGRIQRLLINYLLNIDKNFVDKTIKSPLNYIRVLGFNNDGRKILNTIKKQSEINLVTKKRDIYISNDNDKKLFDLENRATDLYYINRNNYIKELQNKVYMHLS